MKISTTDLLNGLKNSVLTSHGNTGTLASRTVKALMLAATISLSGCASPAYNAAQNAVGTSYGQTQIKEVTHSNYKDIVGNAKSGVYAHPLYEGKLATYHFSNDADAENAIKADLRSLGISESNYDYNRTIFDMVNSGTSSASRHIQDPIGYHDDINYSYVNAKTVYEFNDEGISGGDGDAAAARGYFIMIHEVAHSVLEQQMNFLDFAELPFKRDMLYYLENSSDAIGMLKTIQMLDDTGKNASDINAFIDRKVRLRSNINKQAAFESDSDYGDRVLHRTVQTLKVIKKMYNDNPESITEMSNDEILIVGDMVASISADYDFKHDFINEIVGERQDMPKSKADLELGEISEKFLNFLSRPTQQRGLTLPEELAINADMLTQLAGKMDNEIMKNVAMEIASDPERYYYDNKDNSEATIKGLLDKSIDDLKISDISASGYIGHMTEYTGFYNELKDRLSSEGIHVGKDTNNDNNRTLASTFGFSR
nr:hypothetical protein [Vibrio splendidus]MCC4880302.1 hypothetical protein [Vibrio splendidus]